MRLLFTIVIFFVAAEVIDAVWFDGRYTQAISQSIGQEFQQAKNQLISLAGPTFIHPPNLSHHWKIP
jgi:hypothetical protein